MSILRYILIIAIFVFAACKGNDTEQSPEPKNEVSEIVQRGYLKIGTTGDYRPLSFLDPQTGEYWGFGIEMAEAIAKKMGVEIRYVPTSWPTLSVDVMNDTLMDFAIGGITITDKRKETMAMSIGYLNNGKTILCRVADAQKYHSTKDLNLPTVRVMVNPGGLNEKFAHDSLPLCNLIVFDKNEEIPEQVAEGNADVMITEITEAPWYILNDSRLAAPLISAPFTHGEIGVLMQQGKDSLMSVVNTVILEMKANGELKALHEEYFSSYLQNQ